MRASYLRELQARFDQRRIAFERMARKAETVAHIEHGPTPTKHMSEDLANAAPAAIGDEFLHQRIAETVTVEIAAHEDSEFRALAVRIFRKAPNARRFLAASIREDDKSHLPVVVDLGETRGK